MDFVAARGSMVDGQIRTNKVVDPALIAAMRELPRELFVPQSRRFLAYVDEDVEIAAGRYLMEPMVLARLLQAAAIDANDVVLDVGPGTGYSTALLARLAGTVVGVDDNADLAGQAEALLQDLSIDNAAVIAGDMGQGYPKQGPYDVILINGAVDRVPPALTDQLADGGRLVTVIGGTDVIGAVGRATLILKTQGTLSQRVLFDAATPILPGFQVEPGFEF